MDKWVVGLGFIVWVAPAHEDSLITDYWNFRDVRGGSCTPGLQKRGLGNPTSREGTQVLVYEDNFDKLPQQVRKDEWCCGSQSRTLSACRDVSKIRAFPDSSRIDFVLANPNVSTLVHVDGNVSRCTFLGCSGAAEIVPTSFMNEATGGEQGSQQNLGFKMIQAQ